MKKDNTKKISNSLQVFFKSHSLSSMTQEELLNLPKEVIIACASQEIAFVWFKLPKHLQDDPDIEKYRFCDQHHNIEDDLDVDVNDGPPPRKIFCCYCNIKDNYISSKNNIDKLIPCCTFQ